MVFSYLGLSKPLTVVNEAIMSYIGAYYKKHGRISAPLTPGGVYGTDISAVANFAAANDMCAYITADEMIRKSDIIFCFLPDKAIRTLAQSLRGHGIRNKIFCHFTPAFDANILDFGTDNTYISFFIPVYQHMQTGKIKPKHIFAEGYGDRFDEVTYIAEMLDIPLTLISTEDKAIYLTAANFLNDFSTYIEQAAKKLMRISLYSRPELADTIFKQYKSQDHTLNSYDPIKGGNVRFLENQSDMLSALGLKDVSTLFGSLLLAESRMIDSDKPGYSRITDIAKRLINK